MWKDGKRYEGDFVNDKREGEGTFIWADGRRYIGGWRAGKQDGEGTYINQKNETRRGVWKNGRKVQWLDGGAPGGDDKMDGF